MARACFLGTGAVRKFAAVSELYCTGSVDRKTPRSGTDSRWTYAGMGLCTLGIFVRLIGGETEHALLPDGRTVADAMRVLSPLVPWHSGVHMVYEGKVLEPQQGLGELGITTGASLS